MSTEPRADDSDAARLERRQKEEAGLKIAPTIGCKGCVQAPRCVFLHRGNVCHQSEVDGKDAEIELLRMQLAACSEAARANTRMVPCNVALEYQSASFNDVRGAVEREMDHREAREKAEALVNDKAKFIAILSHELELPRVSHSEEEDYIKAIRELKARVADFQAFRSAAVEFLDAHDFTRILEQAAESEGGDKVVARLRLGPKGWVEIPDQPHRAVEVDIHIGADDMTWAVRRLVQMATLADERGQIVPGASGSPDAGTSIEVATRPEQTSEKYHAELEAHLAACKDAKDEGAAK